MTSAVCSYQVLDVQIVASLVQTYVSNSTVDQEAIYIFPLPPDAAVCAFKAVIDGKKTINGIVKEKEEAKAEYTAAIAAGKTAGLLEKEHADIFQVSLGNLKPKQTIDVHISYVAIIAHDGSAPESLRLMLPVTVAPRYGGPAPSNLYNSISVRSKLQITISVQMTANISSITSPTHPVALTLGSNSATPAENHDPTRAFVSLESNDFLEKDVVLIMSAQKIDRPRCSVERDEEGSTDAYSLTLVPRFELPVLPRQNYIFLVDRSGSMGGFRINAVRAALQIMLKSLPTKDTSFNIWSFGSRYSSLWPASKVYSSATVKEATTHIDTIDANYGGTEIESALRAVYESTKSGDAATNKVPTSVFVLTDGEAWNLEGVLQTVRSATLAAKEDKNLLRSFVLGVGDDVSTPMCDGIARAGKGIAVFVGNNEKPDAKLMGLLKAARSAVIEDLAVDWGSKEVPPPAAQSEDDDDFEVIDEPKAPAPIAPISLFDETPKPVETPVALGPGKVVVNLGPPPRIQQAPELEKLPIPLYPGFRTSIFAIIKRDKGEVRPECVKITGKVLGAPVVLEVPAIVAAPSPLSELIGKNRGILHILAARALIQGLEDQPKSDENAARIVRLGTRYSLASSQTSFVAVDDEGEIKSEVPAPVELEESVQEEERARPAQFLGGGMKKNKRVTSSSSSYAMVPQRYSAQQSFMGGAQLMSLSAGAAPPRFANSAAPRPSPAPAGARPAPQMFNAPPPPPPSARYRPAAAAPPPQASMMSQTSAFGAPPGAASSRPASARPQVFSFSSTTNASPPPPGAAPGGAMTYGRSSSLDRAPSGSDDGHGGYYGFSSGAPPAPLAPPAPVVTLRPPTIENFAREQDFEGFFPSTALQGVLPNGPPPKPASLESLSASEEQKNNVWCSILILAYLEKMFASDKASWDFFAEKALDYIKDAIPQEAHASIAEWKEKAKACF